MEFKIRRHQGEDETDITTGDSQVDMFQARIEERRQKKLKQIEEKNNIFEQNNEDENIDDKQEKKKKKKEKKKKDKSDIVDTSVDMENGTIDKTDDIENSEETPKKKKKKKKRDSEAGDVSLVEGGDLKATEVTTNKMEVETEAAIKEQPSNDPFSIPTDKGMGDGEGMDIDKTALSEESKEVQGENYFPVLGKQIKVKKAIVKRSLPRWLNEPTLMSADINTAKILIKEVDFLSEKLLKNLESNNIEHLFPVQHSVGQQIMTQNKTAISKYPPRDICVQAPTGSGKTLAYVLPIIDVLSKYIVRQLYCLVVVPSKDLAVQVHKVFEAYTKGTHLKVALASGLKTFSKEQDSLVTKGGMSKVDIVVSTPGRLVDHLKQTPGFSLNHLRFLVVDEADRLLGQDYSSWLAEVKTAVHSADRPKPFPINVSTFLGCHLPFQKLLFSATLTQNPEKLASLELYHPILFTSKLDNKEVDVEDEENTKDALMGDGERFIIPENLEEKMIVVEADQKPLVLVYLMLSMKYKGVLCFTNSISATHRLCLLLQSFQGFTVAEFSSTLSETQRKGVIRDFNSGKVDLLISSDAMARGMDINAVKLVVNYDPAANAKTYVHRVGRTARAGKDGCAISVLHSKEVYHFKLMVKKLSAKVIPKLNIPKDTIKSYQEDYEKALNSLQDKISKESRNTSSGGNFVKRT